MLWDIFCKVIDNHGDVGVCWRLAVQLAGRGESVRLWIDDASALAWMAPQGCPGVEVRGWGADTANAAESQPGDVVIEAFGCTLDTAFVASMARRKHETGRQPRWINLEYLSAEAFVERCHGLPSPVLSGPGEGLLKHFFYPGFTAATGGLLREPGLDERRARFDRAAWLRTLGIGWTGERLVSLFCYEPAALSDLLAQLAGAGPPTRLLVTAGRATAAVKAAVQTQVPDGSHASARAPALTYLPLLAQHDYDHLLWACDVNFVRGEDSLVRALWAGKPFVWQIYPQDDGAHETKLEAFLDWQQAPAGTRRWHAIWNGIESGRLPPLDDLAEEAVRAAVARLEAQPDLVTRLLHFVHGR